MEEIDTNILVVQVVICGLEEGKISLKKCWTKPNHGTLMSFIIRYRCDLEEG
jgi:hypothetical protein